MPVTVAKVDLKDPAQRADLEKIYADSPTWMRRDLSPEDFVEQWIVPCDEIWGGWFNGRILGAVGIRKTKEGQQLIGICVREVTRRRGVAFQMMEAVLKELTGHVYIDTRQQPSTDILFDHLGFTKSDPVSSEAGTTWVRWKKDLA